MSIAFIIPVLIGVVVFGVGIFLSGRLQNPDNLQDRLRKIGYVENSGVIQQDDNFLVGGGREGILAAALRKFLTGIGINFEKYHDSTEIKFLQAGVSSPNALVYYIFMKKFGIFLAAAVVAVIWFFSQAEGALKAAVILVCIIVTVLLTLGADLYLSNSRQKRQLVLQRSFPDGLDLILVCVESGLALDGALARVCKELRRAHPVLTDELNKTRMELTLLNDREKALNNLALRTGLVPFRALVGALLQSEKFGTSLSETLRVLSEDYRYTRMMLAENKAAKIPAKMTVVMMLTMIPAFIAVVMTPAMLNVMDKFANK